MRAVKEARQYIERNPADPSAVVLAKLVLALEMERRAAGFSGGRPRLFDASLQMAEMSAPPQPPAAPAAFPAEPTATAAPAGV